MKEKDIRDRIAQFLKKTARTVVVPASMGLGLSSAGCDRHSLHSSPTDAGPDSAAQSADAPMSAQDLADAARMSDAAIKHDLPLIMVPYVVAMPPDAADVAQDMEPDLAPDIAPDLAPDVAPEAVGQRGLDADRDASEVPLDVRADIPYPPPPYLAPPPPPVAPDELPGRAQGASPTPLPPPAKK